MRGRKPRQVTIAPADYHVLCLIARGDSLPTYQVQRARIVLAIAGGERTGKVAEQVGCDEATVWRACRRYEEAGLSGLLADGRRSA
ncbi:MAG: helix-turn-helix domain-containing protein [Gemmataceae bacterium]|nr:helix-turn-helix domain-containing protein [Gemmataceae bacterium]